MHIFLSGNIVFEKVYDTNFVQRFLIVKKYSLLNVYAVFTECALISRTSPKASPDSKIRMC